MRLGEIFPDFAAETDCGSIESFHDWIGDGKWAILFSHPADFTPVCTTELARAATLSPEFEARNVRLIALSCDSVVTHRDWAKDIAAFGGQGDAPLPFPIIADERRKLATELGMLDPLELASDGLPLTARAVFFIGPNRKLRAQILYPASTGRQFEEILRVVDSLQLTDKHPVATPESWTMGGKCVVQPSLPTEKATELLGPEINTFPLPSGKSYLRFVGQPE